MIGTGLGKVVCASPNFSERRGEKPITYLILHYTGMSDAQKACAWLCNPVSQVSCHYLVDEQGGITQMVSEDKRAWHAGVSSWGQDDDINSLSIGIEIQNCGHGPDYGDFPKLQMDSVADLSLDIMARNIISARHVLAHSDIAPGRKVDPGEKFDWPFLFEKGVGHLVEAEPLQGGAFIQEGDQGDAVLAWQGMLRLYGYGLDASGIFDARTKIVTQAFQLHFRRARVDGVADFSTIATLHKLLRAVS